MSYGKRDEDADGAIIKVDRTAVFQEGEFARPGTALVVGGYLLLLGKWSLTKPLVQLAYSIPRPYRREDVEFS